MIKTLQEYLTDEVKLHQDLKEKTFEEKDLTNEIYYLGIIYGLKLAQAAIGRGLKLAEEPNDDHR